MIDKIKDMILIIGALVCSVIVGILIWYLYPVIFTVDNTNLILWVSGLIGSILFIPYLTYFLITQGFVEWTLIKKPEEKVADTQTYIQPVVYNHPSLAHILLHGGAGQGKTSLVEVTRNELVANYGHQIEYIKVVPSQVRGKRDLDEIMLRVAASPYCILFIDEIHGLSQTIEESLYAALQDFEYDITLTKDIPLVDGFSISINEGRGVQSIKLPKFTCIGATTILGKINKPLKDRFPIKIEMTDYETNELVDIINVYLGQENPDSFDTYIGQENAVGIIKMNIDALRFNDRVSISEEAKQKIAGLSMKTARLVKQRSKNCIVYAKSIGSRIVTSDVVDKTMEMFGVDKSGLDRVHRAIISHLLRQKNKPVGSQALAEAVGVTKDDIDAVYVPELTKTGILTRDGRSMKILTEEAYEKYSNERVPV